MSVGKVEATAQLERAVDGVRGSAEVLDEAVAVARRAGVSWASIGQATGMTRQSAHERWSSTEQTATT